MPRRENGSITGKTNTPTTALASGIWSLDEIARAQRDGVWPAVDVITATRTANFGSGSTTSAYNFNVAIGAARADRRVVVGIAYEHATGAAISSISIGGVAADIEIQNIRNNIGIAIVTALVPTGTTATVSVTLSANTVRCYGVVWSLTKYQSGTPIDVQNSVNTNPPTVTITPGLTSVAIGFAAGYSTAARTWTWSGLTERTESNINDSINFGNYTGADGTFNDSTPAVITATKVGTNTNDGLVVAVFQ